jgi:hypothetical protein
VDSSKPQSSVALLDHLYRRYKALTLSIGASLTVRRRPDDAIGAVEELLGECERAEAHSPPELREHFAACRDATGKLGELARETVGGEPPSAQGLDATRASHRRLRKLVWDVVNFEYVPCSAHAGESEHGPEVSLSVGSRGA